MTDERKQILQNHKKIPEGEKKTFYCDCAENQ